MKYTVTVTALLAAFVSADSRGCTQDGHDNWYCQEVTAISYTNVGNTTGDMYYNKVTGMSAGNGACSSTPYAYTGAMSPLDEEVSMHFRGPLTLKQFAFYSPTSAGNSRRSTHQQRHAHGHAHAHLHHARDPSPVEEKRQVGATVTATIDGLVQTWINEWSGLPTGAPAAPAPAAAAPAVQVAAAAPAAPSASSATSSSGSSWGSSTSPDGAWTRQAYYDSESGTSEGLVFLNHHGGSGSGVFDTTFGNSLSYASADGSTGASSPQILADTTLSSSDEIVIMSNQECSGENGDCGYYRDGSVAYHGFGGANKAFFFEFGMPSDGQTAASPYDPVNMPAIWLLNAQIPRTVQYGPADCSCWTTGCGEFDIFEVLEPGDSRCKSTLHGNIQGGDSNYFARPFVGTIKAVLIMTENNMHIKVLDSDADFGADFAGNILSSIISDTMAAIAGVSLFPLA